MENLLSTTIPTISGTGPIPPFPPLTGWHFDPNSAETVELVDEYLKKNITYPDGEIEEAHQLTCVEEYGGGFFSPNTFKEKRAFLAFPKSGSEWTKALVLAAFGMLIHKQIYKPLPSSNSDLLNYSTCDCWMLQKDHDIGLEGHTESRIEFYNSEAILLIRNPFLSLIQTRYYVNYYNYHLKNGGSAGPVDQKNLFIENEGWGTFVDRKLKLWENLYTLWIKGVKRGGVIYYERLEADTETELLRLGGLMGLTWIDKNRLDCALNRGRPSNVKNEIYSYSNDPYSPAQKLQISEAIDRVQLLLMEYGFDPLPTEMYEFYEPTDLLSEDGCNPQ